MNDDTVMWRSKRRERAEATITRLRPISPWLLILAVVMIVAVTWPLTAWLYGIAGNDPARRLEAIKIGLTAAAGTGGALALLLAFRRQLATEIIATETREAQEREYEQRDRAADASERDAAERRITELYTRAVDQLGNGQAPVRLGGLHALERLAQTNPDQRQTIVDVICAYLRMPYMPPEDQPPAEDAPAEAHTRHENRRQELQVRLTAQRILAAHLRPDRAADAFWPDIDLDLTGAYLYDFTLAHSHIRIARFSGAQFHGRTSFHGAQVGVAWLNDAQFAGPAFFHGVRIRGAALFNDAQFVKNARFEDARFIGGAIFYKTKFTSTPQFERAQFTGAAGFDDARFYRAAKFEGAQFIRTAAKFDGARVKAATLTRVHSWPAGWTTRQAAEGEEDGWLYLVRVEDGGEQQPDQEDQIDSEAGTPGT